MRTGNERSGIFVLSVQDDFTPVGIFDGNPPPRKTSVTILRIGICFNLHRTLEILAKNILDWVQVMLAHVAQPTAIIIPITAKTLVNAMWVIRFHWRWPQPEVVIKFWRNWLLNKIGPTTPLVLFPIKACGSSKRYFNGPAKESSLRCFLDRFYMSAHSVEYTF